MEFLGMKSSNFVVTYVHKPLYYGISCAMLSRTLIKNPNGYRFLATESCCQIIKIYGGKRMSDIFALHFATWSYSNLEMNKGMRYVAREHAIFYKYAMKTHNIVGPIHVIFAKNITSGKQHIALEGK